MTNTQILASQGKLGDIRSVLGDSSTDASCDEQINSLSPKEIVVLWCQWEGILGSYPNHIMNLYDALKAK